MLPGPWAICGTNQKVWALKATWSSAPITGQASLRGRSCRTASELEPRKEKTDQRSDCKQPKWEEVEPCKCIVLSDLFLAVQSLQLLSIERWNRCERYRRFPWICEFHTLDVVRGRY